jgi:RNA-directed DNA polymerase
VWPVGRNNNNFNINYNNNRASRGIGRTSQDMKTHKNLYEKIYSIENLESAFKKSRKGKTKKSYIIEFEKNLRNNLTKLMIELVSETYKPRPLITFIIREPKTRKISKSDFRDRVIHHAICNIIEPLFDKTFIYDSYANRKGKGTLKAIERFDEFKRKASKNFTIPCYALKMDIEHYFDNVDHETLIKILSKKIIDEKTINLIKIILQNHKTHQAGKGMPLGNLTSQFFANAYLNELDKFVKHKLNAHHYIRYVDDFVILHESIDKLERYREQIDDFLKVNLQINLHSQKSRIIKTNHGIPFLGLRIFDRHKLLKKTNIRKFRNKLRAHKIEYEEKTETYDKIYDFLEGWINYAKQANSYTLRKVLLKETEQIFIGELSNKEIDRIYKANPIIFHMDN